MDDENTGVVQFSNNISVNLIIHTTEEWEATNPILEKGLLGYDSSRALLKVGNGYQYWNDLEVANGGNGIEDAPNDNGNYVRINKKWCPIIDEVVTYPVFNILTDYKKQGIFIKNDNI